MSRKSKIEDMNGKGHDEMGDMIIIKGLPDHMIRRILLKEASNSELAYVYTKTIILIPMDEGGTFVAFDGNEDWNYRTDMGTEELLGRMSGIEE